MIKEHHDREVLTHLTKEPGVYRVKFISIIATATEAGFSAIPFTPYSFQGLPHAIHLTLAMKLVKKRTLRGSNQEASIQS